MICGCRRDEKSWAWNLVWPLPRYLLCVGWEFARPPAPLQPISERLSQWSSDLQTERASRQRTRRRPTLCRSSFLFRCSFTLECNCRRRRHSPPPPNLWKRARAQNLIKRETIDFRFLSPCGSKKQLVRKFGLARARLRRKPRAQMIVINLTLPSHKFCQNFKLLAVHALFTFTTAKRDG